jgi:adenosylcobinamide kinase/adenosylcobinamide-phosphate guanylyltransferase
MSLERLGGGAVLVDDVLLDPTPETLVVAVFGGPPLQRVTTVLYTRSTKTQLPGISGLLGSPDYPQFANFRTGTAETWGDGWLLRTTTEGLLLHCPKGRAQVPEGAVLTVRNPRLSAPLARSNRRVLVTGGSRSGKSSFAETRIARLERVGRHERVEYVATGSVAGDDAEWAARIATHQQRRPAHWRTTESLAVADILATDGDATLVDGLGTWLAGTLDLAGWAGAFDADLHADVHTAPLVGAFARTRRDVVVVTDEVGDGVVPETSSGRRFRDELGRLNAAFAEYADEVWRVTAGIPTRIR